MLCCLVADRSADLHGQLRRDLAHAVSCARARRIAAGLPARFRSGATKSQSTLTSRQLNVLAILHLPRGLERGKYNKARGACTTRAGVLRSCKGYWEMIMSDVLLMVKLVGSPPRNDLWAWASVTKLKL